MERIKQKNPILGWHTLEDYAREADVKVGDMVRLDLGVKAGFPIGYIQEIKPYYIILTRSENKRDGLIKYRVEDMSVFYGMSKLYQR